MAYLLAATSILVSAVFGTDDPVVVVVGDSWGAYGHHNLQQVLKDHGSNLSVKSYAIGGTTSEFWARNPDLISNLVSDNPTAEYGTKYIFQRLHTNHVQII